MIVPAARKLDFVEIPVIDLRALVEGKDSGISATVEAIAHACETVGFLYVKNHGVASSLLERLLHVCKSFFALPLEARMAVAVERSPQFRGYLPLEYGGRRSGGKKGPNLQEAFHIMHERPRGEIPLDGPNQWPVDLPELKPAMIDYFSAAESLGRKMLHGFSLALGQNQDFLDGHFTSPMTMMKLNHYPPQPALTENDKIGVTGHSDAGAFTLLWQDDLGGLELLDKSGDWVQVPPIEGTFVINIGDMMQRWSGNRFRSTTHRVINRSGHERYSIPLFMNPNYTTEIKPLWGSDPTENTIVSGEYLFEYWHRIYPQRTSEV